MKTLIFACAITCGLAAQTMAQDCENGTCRTPVRSAVKAVVLPVQQATVCATQKIAKTSANTVRRMGWTARRGLRRFGGCGCGCGR